MLYWYCFDTFYRFSRSNEGCQASKWDISGGARRLHKRWPLPGQNSPNSLCLDMDGGAAENGRERGGGTTWTHTVGAGSRWRRTRTPCKTWGGLCPPKKALIWVLQLHCTLHIIICDIRVYCSERNKLFRAWINYYNYILIHSLPTTFLFVLFPPNKNKRWYNSGTFHSHSCE